MTNGTPEVIVPEGKSLQAETLAFLQNPQRLFINGQWVDSSSSDRINVVNPATGQIISTLCASVEEDVDRAVSAARIAFDTVWRRYDPAERGRLLWLVADLLDQQRDIFAEIETLDNGKPLGAAHNDIDNAVKHFRYFAGLTTKIEGSTIPVSKPALVYTVREPLGVVGLITPWNFPLLMAAWKLAPSLACGNTAVIKPAENTSLTTLRLAQLMQEAGIPDGVVNVVTGYGATTGAAISGHQGISKVSFTGSTGVGRHIMQAAAKSNLKKLSLELGGKNAQVIFADADIDKALADIHWASFFNSGQECTGSERLYVERSIYPTVIERLKQLAEQMTIGNGLNDVDLGPIVSQQQLDTILNAFQVAQKQGARLVTGGQQLSATDLNGGYFMPPTVFAHDDEAIDLVREEVFGPVVSVTAFDEFDEVVSLVNNSIYGLVAGVWTENIKRAHIFAGQVDAGVVWINGYDQFDPAAPFGGVKQSGFGREFGKDAIELFTQVKTVWVGMG